MTAFPFGDNPPSLGKFIEDAINLHGAEIIDLGVTVEGAYGKTILRALERNHNGKVMHVILPTFPDDCLLTGHTVRYLCDRLGIPTSNYGFILSDDGLTPFDPSDMQ